MAISRLLSEEFKVTGPEDYYVEFKHFRSETK
jgi:hypothetical protein